MSDAGDAEDGEGSEGGLPPAEQRAAVRERYEAARDGAGAALRR